MGPGLAFAVSGIVVPAALFAGWLASTQGDYFDPALEVGEYPCTLDERFGGIKSIPTAMDEGMNDWFSGPLRATGEPSLFREPPSDGATTVRFTFLPAFVEPIIVRVEDLYGEQPRLIATRDVGQVHVREGRDHLRRTLDQSEVAPIINLIRTTDVLNQPPDSCLSGIDGYVFLIEANGPEGYRFINRWVADEGPVYELGLSMFRLTGWPTGPQGPDQTPGVADEAWREWLSRQPT